MTDPNRAVTGFGRHYRPTLTRKLIALPLVATASLLVMTAGSFLPRGTGILLFGDSAEAKCKSGLTNIHNDNPHYWGKVVTKWCYRHGNVTKRRSKVSAGIKPLGYARGYAAITSRWTYSQCHSFHGYFNHNCLTHREFFVAGANADPGGNAIHPVGELFCIQTRIYGNGDHTRRVIEDEPCPDIEPPEPVLGGPSTPSPQDICVGHPADESVVCVRNAGHTVDVCDRDPDGHYAYARVITEASNPSFLSPYYDDNGSQRGCANLSFTSTVLSVAVCVQYESCSAFKPTY